ncbi:hypothetical protein B0T13DRAFT_243666 [Neurospora crassa]|nr:hypothetical protein B0T13DRAFT_243666 [Neurospora crassa]
MDIDPKLRSSGNHAAHAAPTPTVPNKASMTTSSIDAAVQNASGNTKGGRGINAPSPRNNQNEQQLHSQYHPNSQAHVPSGQPDHSSQLQSATGSQTNSPLQSQFQYQSQSHSSAQPHNIRPQLQTPHRQPGLKGSAPSQATAHNPLPFSSFPPQSPTSSVGYSPNSSAAAGTATANDAPANVPSPSADGGGRDPNGEPKKPRACESCRSLKVRCEPDPANPNGDCKRCAKAKRPCIVTEPSRKRQKKADNRVAELEKKIDALTATLQNVRGGTNPLSMVSPSASSATTGPDAQAVPRYTTATSYDPNENGSGRGVLGQPLSATRDWPITPREQPTSGRQPTPSRAWTAYDEMDRDNNPYTTPNMAPGGQKRKHTDDKERASQDPRDDFSVPRPPIRHPDIVDRNIISMAQAAAFFERYNEHMVPHLPGVVFSTDMTVDKLRRTQPILFHAIMAAAAGEIPSVQKILTIELMKRFAEEVMVTGTKSLELVQAIQVATIWYWPPERFEELKFYQLLHIAAVMAIDLGLGRKRQPRGGLRNGMPSTLRDKIMYRPPPPDPTSIESRRAWLTCYFLATNTSMALHRPNLIRWSWFMEESVKILETSPEAAPTDKYLCHLIWTHRLAEEVGINFFDDHNSGSSITILRTQHLLSYFEHKLNEYQKSLPDEMRQPSLMLSFYVLDLYMHEIVWQNESPDDGKGSATLIDGQTAWLDGNLTPAHVKALSATLEAIKHIFDVFLTMEVHSIRCLPAFSFVRIAYAVVILIRIYLSVISPKTELGKVMRKEDVEVEKWIEKLLEKFKATMADDKNRPAAKFFFVLGMLRQWFQAQKQPAWPKGSSISRAEAGPSGAGSAMGALQTEPSSTPPFASNQISRKDDAADKDLTPVAGSLRSNQIYKQQQQQQQQPNASDYPTTADTPLHLLSEVATHESSSVPTPSSGPPPPPGKPTVSAGPSSSQHTAHMPNNANIILSAPISAASSGAAVDWNLRSQPQPAQQPTCLSNANSSVPIPDMNQQQPSTGPLDPLPWLSQAFIPEFEPANFGDGFEQAMDLTLGGLAGDDFNMMALGMGLGMGVGMDLGGGGGFDGGLGAGFGGQGAAAGLGGARSAYDYGQGWYGAGQQQHQGQQQQNGNQGGSGGGSSGGGGGHGQQQQQQQQHAVHGGHGGHHAGGMNPIWGITDGMKPW